MRPHKYDGATLPSCSNQIQQSAILRINFVRVHVLSAYTLSWFMSFLLVPACAHTIRHVQTWTCSAEFFQQNLQTVQHLWLLDNKARIPDQHCILTNDSIHSCASGPLLVLACASACCQSHASCLIHYPDECIGPRRKGDCGLDASY